MKIELERAKDIINSFKNRKILVVGDLILDKYLFGEVERISPEAPVPIVDIKEETLKLGGASNVAWNISKLGGKAYIVGVIGNDENGKILKRLLKEKNIEDLSVVDNDRLTTEKTRVIAVSQQLLRIDRENRKSLSAEVLDKIKKKILDVKNDIEGIIISDYGKGVITYELMEFLKNLNLPIFVDPKPSNFHLYKKTTIMTPNKKEAYECVKMNKENPIELVGEKILKELETNQLLITLGAEGMALFENDKITRIPAKAKKVFDVTGAGDTVISVLALAKLSGGTWLESAILSNLSAGYVVGEIGTAVLTSDKLLEIVKEENV
jgi:rfaE bifunctional protein kinase chain/domain